KLHVDEASQDGGRKKGRAPHVLREMLKALAQLGALDVALHQSRVGVLRLDGEHELQGLEWPGLAGLDDVEHARHVAEEKVFLADAKKLARLERKLAKAFDVFRSHPRNFIEHGFFARAEVDRHAILKKAAPLRIEGHELKVVLDV